MQQKQKFFFLHFSLDMQQNSLHFLSQDKSIKLFSFVSSREQHPRPWPPDLSADHCGV